MNKEANNSKNQEKQMADEKKDVNGKKSDVNNQQKEKNEVQNEQSFGDDVKIQGDGSQAQQKLNELEAKVKKLETENAELTDRLARRQAEFENSRKRILKEKDESIKYANQILLFELTSVVDDFERAIKSSEESKNYDSFHNGIALIEQQLVSLLERKWGLKRFSTVGEPFDPLRHEGIAVCESDSLEVPTVAEEYQKGYLLNERVLRPAKVKVAQPKVEKPEGNTNNTSDSNNRENK